MSSKREEERNEKIIRGLMKLPPNRRCINCNSLGPQYVCTNFWTFVCTTCSGIHREFTHRVKSVSMAKFTFQEVDALQKGGNQRARELFLKAWDLQRNRLPDNSNVDKVREFIKNVYVDKKYSVQKSSDKPPRDPQSLRSHEDETRRASSYHSYSQSPPYDFQYEERRYGKHGPTLTRPGSDRGFYEGKLASFLSPTHLNDEKFANEGSYPRISDYSVSGGGDPFRSDVLSPSSWKESGSPFSETSRDISGEVPQVDSFQRNSDENSRSNGGRIRHPQRTASSGSFGSFDSSSMSFRSVNSLGLPEVGSEPAQSAVISHEKSSSFQSLPQSSGSMTFDGLDLFSAPFAPQNGTVTSPTGSNSQLPQSSLAESVNVVQQSPISSVPLFTEQQSSQIPEPLPLDLFVALSQQHSAVSSHGKASDAVIPNSGGWATFDMPLNVLPMGTETASAAAVPSSNGNNLGNLNPFSIDQNSSYEGPTGHEPPSSMHTFGHENSQNIEATINNTHFWNAFDDSAGGQPIQDVLKINGQTAVHCTSDADKSLGSGVYEANDGTVRTADVAEPPSSSLSSDFSMALNDFPMVAAVAGTHPFAIDNKPTNPFDLPFDPDMESSNMSQFWNMSSLQAALPSTQTPTSYVGGVEESWFPQNSVSSYVPGGVSFDPTSVPLGFIAGQAASAPVQTIHTQGPVASVGGNPFA
ncbi:probable ADP-ribosylation factor GTPase-activating protein AGD14 isoform X1 [Sesamum indicum]|uniref:Probable ADP-ribosylation factor GTPase-activating protein AGD14 isoform X1 n=1 Tax=Sesamum indicum TaxID=4182 RepID=A0A6I9SJJ1_SESIN|nr:probable ADP-ribosylation factor GTPase-activating protein AGD14 isoform X1 [Sesamum indicum]XP_011070021.1 probable ADP-ribosylation factor GTPase-activating protein AGD14 isoform X1 [Sesamum indicum]